MSKIVQYPQCYEPVRLIWFEDGKYLTGKCGDYGSVVSEFEAATNPTKEIEG